MGWLRRPLRLLAVALVSSLATLGLSTAYPCPLGAANLLAALRALRRLAQPSGSDHRPRRKKVALEECRSANGCSLTPPPRAFGSRARFSLSLAGTILSERSVSPA